MSHGRVFLAVVLLLGWTVAASAQSGLGGLRGAVVDPQGGGLPGVTVTASSPDVLRPQTDVTNERGEYRLINLPPGTYTLTAELPGFATFRREGILIRAGATFAVDFTMQLSDAPGDGHGDRRLADDRGRQARQRPEHRRRVPAADADPGAPQLQRLPRADARRDLARLRRRQRPAGLFRPRHRALRPCAAARGHHRHQLSRRPAHLRVDGRRHGAGHPGQDRRRRRQLADGRRPGDEHRHQERRQHLPRQRRLGLSAVRLERQQRRQLLGGARLQAGQRRHADHGLRAAVRRRGRRPDHEGQGLVLRRAAPCRLGRRHQPDGDRGRAHQGLSSRTPSCSTTTARAGSRSSRSPRAPGSTTCRASTSSDRLLLSRRPRVQLRADPGAVDRRAALQRQDHVGVGHAHDDDVHGVVQRQGRQRRLDVRVARPPGRRSSSTTAPRLGQHLSGTGRILEGGNLQSYAYQPASQIVAARRPHLLQGRLGGQPRVPDRLLRRPAQHLRPDDRVRQRRLRARGAPARRPPATSPAAPCRSTAATTRPCR